MVPLFSHERAIDEHDALLNQAPVSTVDMPKAMEFEGRKTSEARSKLRITK